MTKRVVYDLQFVKAKDKTSAINKAHKKDDPDCQTFMCGSTLVSLGSDHSCAMTKDEWTVDNIMGEARRTLALLKTCKMDKYLEDKK